MNALAIEHASIALGGKPILRDVTLQVADGEFVAVLGSNGAGKSTLMRAILGLIPLSAGTLSVLGRPPAEARPDVGYLPQRHSFDSSTRVRGVDLVRLGLDGTRWGVPVPLTRAALARRRAERGRVAEVIELVDGTGYATRPIGELSGGEQQRLLILDEPLDSLDLPSQAAVAALLQRISITERVCVLLVAHDVNPLISYLDRVVYLAGGHALAGAVDEVITAPKLSRLYGTPIEVLRTSDGRLVVVGTPEPPHHHGHRHDH